MTNQLRISTVLGHSTTRRSFEFLDLGAPGLAIPTCRTYTTQVTTRWLQDESDFMLFQSRSLRHFIFSTLLVVNATAPSFAVTEKSHKGRISLEEAQRLAEVANSESDFPIVINDLVFRHLNRYLKTPHSRREMRKSLERLEEHRPLIEAKMDEYRVPEEVMALPIIESRVQNKAQRPGKSKVAGLWMFLDSTARKFGLRVNSTVDDRLNVPLQTDAAMRYLSLNQKRFEDWQLGILAYNMGEGALAKTIRKHGTRDAFVLNQNAPAGDREYLAKVMAVALILKNPTLLN